MHAFNQDLLDSGELVETRRLSRLVHARGSRLRQTAPVVTDHCGRVPPVDVVSSGVDDRADLRSETPRRRCASRTDAGALFAAEPD